MTATDTSLETPNFCYIYKILFQSIERKTRKGLDLFDSFHQRILFIHKLAYRIIQTFINGDQHYAAASIYKSFYEESCSLKETIALCKEGIYYSVIDIQNQRMLPKNKTSQNIANISRITERSLRRKLKEAEAAYLDFMNRLNWFESIAPKT